MQDPLYREIILEHWQNPQNFGVLNEPSFDVSGDNPLCGDHIRLTGLVVEGRLIDIAFTAESCSIAQASASIFTERVKGMTLEDAGLITPDEVLSDLGVELTPARTKCALLVSEVMRRHSA